MGLVRTLCLYPCALLTAVLAALLGFFAVHPMPEARMFATLIPLSKGYLPAEIVGDEWWASRTPVPAVPKDAKAGPRPEGEIMLPMLGGDRMPALGLGLCCRPTAYDTTSVSRSVLWYLLQGGRHLDTAHLYMNHKAVGIGIAEAIARGVPRREIFLVTKIPPRFFSGGDVDELVARFLEELQVEYLDVLLLHSPDGMGGFGSCRNGTAAACRANVWTRMSALRERGLIRNLGVSNHAVKHIEELNGLGLAPVAVNQIQFNPWAPDFQQALVAYCQAAGIVVTAWSPFQGTMMQHSSMFTVETLTELAAATGKTAAQVVLRWAVQKGVSAIPGTGNPAHMAENLAVHTFSLSDAQMAAIDAVRSDPKARAFVAQGFQNSDEVFG
jgi:diketogulonate reductase-like aldo/keto reductase